MLLLWVLSYIATFLIGATFGIVAVILYDDYSYKKVNRL